MLLQPLLIDYAFLGGKLLVRHSQGGAAGAKPPGNAQSPRAPPGRSAW